MKKITATLPLDSFEQHKLDDKLSQQTTAELLRLLTGCIKYDDNPDDNEYDWDSIHKIQQILAQRLDYVLVDDLNTVLKETLNLVIVELNELKQHFEKHRHNKDKNYSETPIW